MKLTAVASAAAGLAVVALVAAPIASAGPEEDFLKYIADHGITWPSGKTQAVIDTGKAVCTDWANGATLSAEIADLKQPTGFTDTQAATFIGAATGAFCPQYESKLK
jgi:hypothetical protein